MAPLLLIITVCLLSMWIVNSAQFLSDGISASNSLSTVAVIKSSCGTLHTDGIFFNSTATDAGKAKFAEFPWMVSFLPTNTYLNIICGGSVIAPNVVLTAAQCASYLRGWPNFIARAGEWNLQSTNEPLSHQDSHVTEIIIHEHFSEQSFVNNIALLILETPYVWASNVHPICLPEADVSFDNVRCFVSGWGECSSNHLHSPILKKFELTVQPIDFCQADTFNKFYKSHICTFGEIPCAGDPGSPLACADPQNLNHYYQAGIISASIIQPDYVSNLCTNVAYLRSWINEKLTVRGIDFRHFTAIY